MIKLDSAIGDRVGYFGRYSDYNNPDFIMNTAGARCTSSVAAGLCMHSSPCMEEVCWRGPCHCLVRLRLFRGGFAVLYSWLLHGSIVFVTRPDKVTRPVCGLPGYPSDKGNQMWFSTCDHQKLSLTEGTAFPYTCDTMPGNSGGPIWCGPWGRGFSLHVLAACPRGHWSQCLLVF